jgi:hypothetical protein
MINNISTATVTNTNTNTAAPAPRLFGRMNQSRIDQGNLVPSAISRAITDALGESTLLMVVNAGGEGVYKVFIPVKKGSEIPVRFVTAAVSAFMGGEEVWCSEEVRSSRGPGYSKNSYLGDGFIVTIRSNYRWAMLQCRHDTNKKGW